MLLVAPALELWRNKGFVNGSFHVLHAWRRTDMHGRRSISRGSAASSSSSVAMSSDPTRRTGSVVPERNRVASSVNSHAVTRLRSKQQRGHASPDSTSWSPARRSGLSHSRSPGRASVTHNAAPPAGAASQTADRGVGGHRDYRRAHLLEPRQRTCAGGPGRRRPTWADRSPSSRRRRRSADPRRTSGDRRG